MDLNILAPYFKWRQVLWIAGCWMLIGAVDAYLTHLVGSSVFFEATAAYDFQRFLLSNIVAALAAGLLAAMLLLFFLRERMRNRAFGAALLYNSLIIAILSVMMVSLTLTLLYPQVSSIDYDYRYLFIFRSPFLLKNVILWTLVASITIIGLHVNEKYGQGILVKMLLGHYHRPREEERIFMFVDIKSSTTIAEDLGHIQFFNLLKDFYRDCTRPIIHAQGEIYQYVGDEVVISWPIRKGVRNYNCVRCFFLLQEAILQAGDRYRERYGRVPEFKVGLHSGLVTTGEIGVIKKDIVFSGDVLNTTARMQAVCNKFRVPILISKRLLSRLDLPEEYDLQRVGIIELKGKQEKVELFTFRRSLQPAAELANLAAT